MEVIMNKQNIYHPSQHAKQQVGRTRKATKMHKGKLVISVIFAFFEKRLGLSVWLLENSRPYIFRPKKASSRSTVDPGSNFLFSVVRGQCVRPRTECFEGNGVFWRKEKDGQSRNGSKSHGIGCLSRFCDDNLTSADVGLDAPQLTCYHHFYSWDFV